MDIGPGKSEGGGDATAPRSISQTGINLIKEFEGLRLEAYLCAASVWTNGYGSTGPHITPGMKITEQEAEALLIKDLSRFEKAVIELIEVPLTQNEFDACVSFSFNIGTGALADSTFRRRMNAGEDKPTCFREEFCKWVRGSDGPLPGLVRRRKAEIALALQMT